MACDTGGRGWRWVFFGILFLALSGGCQRHESARLPEYGQQPVRAGKAHWVFAVHPLHNPALLHERYAPLIEWVNLRLHDVELRLEASSDYNHFENKLRRREPELALPNPYQTVLALDWGYRVVGKVAGDDDFHGLVLSRRGWQPPPPGTPIRVSCPALTALAACMMPRWQLHQDGLDRSHRIEVEAVGSQESSILNVAQGLVDLAFTWPPPWRLFQQNDPAMADTLEVLRRTPKLVNIGLVARADLDAQQVAAVVQAFVDLGHDPEGRRRLERVGLAGFERADDSRYEPVRQFLTDYERVFGALP